MAIGHEVIRASAGAGKTYQLVTRYVGLLAAGAPPEEIVALTFSRKAAGEILDKIVERLATAAQPSSEGGDKARASLNQALSEGGYPAGLDQDQVLRLLRLLLSRMHVCRVGTLDSFFVKVVRAFPFELGLAGEPSIIDGYAARLARQEVLDRVLSGAQRDKARAALLEGYKQATFGQERKGFEATLDGFVSSLHEVFLEAPWEAPWGRSESIWGGEDPWAFGRDVDPTVEATALGALLVETGVPPKILDRWDAFFAQVRELRPGDPLSERPLTYVLEKLVEVADELAQGAVTLKMDRVEFSLDREAAAHAWRLLARVSWCALRGAQERTRGLWRLLHAYETEYQAAVRRSGRLGFRDVMHLLAPAGGGFGGDAIQREVVAYRMDGAFSHWLLDEFQDTSTLQWRAIRDLIDEVLQDPEGRRTLFYVGDVKQAIYNWRGGNASLFQRIIDHYSPEGERILERPLSRSWRSARPVIDAVNLVFGAIEPDLGLSPAACAAWSREWQVHDTARDDLSGCVSLHELPRVGREQENRVARGALVVALLQELAPHRRGLSVAVLVRANAPGKALAEQLRAAGLPAVWEGDEPVADNSLVATILSLARVADHPGDTEAWEHLRMGPLWPEIEELVGGRRGALVSLLLERIHDGGFEALVREWTARWDRRSPLDLFHAARAEALAGAAREVDDAGETRCLEFVDYVREHATRDLPVPGTITVLTMHRSKGLQWDQVILPDLQDVRGGTPDLLIQRGDDLERTPRWLLSRPPALVCDADPVLRRHLEEVDAEDWYEQLCLLYVAMTRAKRGLDMIISAPPRSSSATYLSTILRAGLARGEALGEGPEGSSLLYRCGDSEWLSASPEQEPPVVPPPLPVRPLGRSGSARRHRTRTPSSAGHEQMAPGELFSGERSAATQRGGAIHELFQEIEWIEDASPEEIAAEWRRAHPRAPAGLEAEFLNATACPAIRSALTRPLGDAEVWRERRFEVLLEGDWVSGAFDRVVLRLDPSTKRPTSAMIMDFKTDRVQGDDLDVRTGAHKGQMELYGRALALITGLDPSRISWTLIYTWAGVTRAGT